MKIFQILAVLSLVFVFAACGKRHTLAEVDRNCTGTYLNVQNRVYRVCNPMELAAYQNGEIVDVHFRITKTCGNSDDYACMMAVEYDHMVEILSVN